MSRAGLNRAEGVVVTSAGASDEILIQQLNSVSGQYEPRQITVANLFAGGSDTPNVNVGASGTAGTLKIFPATAAKGDLKIVATNNTGNTETTITNAAMGQASTVSIPDPGASTANFVLDKGTQTIAGVKTFSSVPIGVSAPVQVYIPTISAQAGAVSVLFSAPFTGIVTLIYASISGAIITSNIVITPSIYHSGTPTAITSGAVTVPFSGSAVGTSATATPSAANTFVAGDTITATITGGVNAVNGVITMLITRTA